MKRIFKITFLASLLIALGMMSSCEKDYYVPDIPVLADTIYYSSDIQPFWDASCISCHNGSGIPLNLNSDVSYNNIIVGNYDDLTNPSGLYLKIAPGGSMETYSTPAQTAMVKKWIEQGALNN